MWCVQCTLPWLCKEYGEKIWMVEQEMSQYLLFGTLTHSIWTVYLFGDLALNYLTLETVFNGAAHWQECKAGGRTCLSCKWRMGNAIWNVINKTDWLFYLLQMWCNILHGLKAARMPSNDAPTIMKCVVEILGGHLAQGEFFTFVKLYIPWKEWII